MTLNWILTLDPLLAIMHVWRNLLFLVLVSVQDWPLLVEPPAAIVLVHASRSRHSSTVEGRFATES